MNRSVRRAALAVLALLVAVGCAPSTMVRGAPAGPTEIFVSTRGAVPPGTTLWMSLDRRLSPASNQVGERFSAHVSHDLLSQDGEVLVPRGARVEGRIVEIRTPPMGEAASIGLAVDSIQMAGVRQRLAGTVVDTEVPGASRIRGRDVLIGAAAGAILGGIIEGGKGALLGGALGAGAGTLISLGTSRRPELPAGTQLAVRIEQPVRSLAGLRGRIY